VIATLQFDLDEPADKYAHIRCTKSLDLALTLFDFAEFLRSELKHANLSPERFEQTERIRDRFYTELSAHDISMDELLY
jgi:hypothetical protein